MQLRWLNMFFMHRPKQDNKQLKEQMHMPIIHVLKSIKQLLIL